MLTANRRFRGARVLVPPAPVSFKFPNAVGFIRHEGVRPQHRARTPRVRLWACQCISCCVSPITRQRREVTQARRMEGNCARLGDRGRDDGAGARMPATLCWKRGA
ncbi:hypothetical protein TraAM80_09830 [Trypanosoma rangeli]|uniref:Uncharacterized protein n=1 Tax=Trypanosoma rangeli TaxID=5698 RepID=A0A3R7M5D3_TRYRA|nr:uncharacterized protein TraAM80_09830 [Trypanosoma rangeli]RNE96473.1 hypothetical protein TraAM80_09830 [Trypanosoma rangeli]|eukprot:RNE96473.1 hypothetical protein TraAM80_09830 [Trypanosoma rangeli]